MNNSPWAVVTPKGVLAWSSCRWRDSSHVKDINSGSLHFCSRSPFFQISLIPASWSIPTFDWQLLLYIYVHILPWAPSFCFASFLSFVSCLLHPCLGFLIWMLHRTISLNANVVILKLFVCVCGKIMSFDRIIIYICEIVSVVYVISRTRMKIFLACLWWVYFAQYLQKLHKIFKNFKIFSTYTHI